MRNRLICCRMRIIRWTVTHGGEEAFVKAKAEDKPIFLGVGYNTCHWWHYFLRYHCLRLAGVNRTTGNGEKWDRVGDSGVRRASTPSPNPECLRARDFAGFLLCIFWKVSDSSTKQIILLEIAEIGSYTRYFLDLVRIVKYYLEK